MKLRILQLLLIVLIPVSSLFSQDVDSAYLNGSLWFSGIPKTKPDSSFTAFSLVTRKNFTDTVEAIMVVIDTTKQMFLRGLLNSDIIDTAFIYDDRLYWIPGYKVRQPTFKDGDWYNELTYLDKNKQPFSDRIIVLFNISLDGK